MKWTVTRHSDRPGWLRRCCGLLVLVVVVAPLSLACGKISRDRTLNIGYRDFPVSLDPHYQNDGNSWGILFNFYDGLVKFSPEMKIQPSLAEAWQQLDDSHVRFVLRPGVRFRNGKPLEAKDVVASCNRIKEQPASALRHQLLGVSSVIADGDRAVIFTTEGPQPTLLNRLSMVFIIPADQAGATEITNPIGTGPYYVANYTPQKELIAEAWDSWRPRPPIKRFRITFDPSGKSNLVALLAGKLDIMRVVPEKELQEVSHHPHLRLETLYRLLVRYLLVCQRAAKGDAARALADPKVRKAMLMALDRERWTRSTYRGAATVASQYIHPAVFGYDPEIEPIPYDLAGAKRLLAEAGYPGGFSADLLYSVSPDEILSTVIADLERLGIVIKAEHLDREAFIRRVDNAPTALVSLGWSGATGDSSDFLNACIHTYQPERGLGGTNRTRYSNPEVDALIEKANVELDRDKRLELLTHAQRIVLAALPMLPLVVRWEYMGVSQDVDIDTRYDGWLDLSGIRWRQ